MATNEYVDLNGATRIASRGAGIRCLTGRAGPAPAGPGARRHLA